MNHLDLSDEWDRDAMLNALRNYVNEYKEFVDDEPITGKLVKHARNLIKIIEHEVQ